MPSKMRISISVLVFVMLACTLSSQVPTAARIQTSITDTPLPTATIGNLPTPSVTIGNIPTQTRLNLPVSPSPAITQLDFLDPLNGWAIASNDGGSILRTVDGGATWLNATPAGLTGIGYSTNLSVLDVNTAWVLIPNADFFTGMLYRTTDGGQSWTSYSAPFGGGSMQFLDAETGRVLADRGAGAGSQSVEMFQSSDGGASWLSVFNNDPTRPDASNTLPLSGIKNGMKFMDADTGWVTGTRPMDGDVYLFVTHDGGVSWEQQGIPLPAGYAAYQYMPQKPAFFGGDGFLPLMIYLTNTPLFTFYATQDGGTTWTGNPLNGPQVIMPGFYSFADSLHGWSWNGENNLYFTLDGTKNWAGIATSLDLSGRLAQLLFVPGPSDQFTGWALSSQDANGHSQLYKTTDNGGTWLLLNP